MVDGLQAAGRLDLADAGAAEVISIAEIRVDDAYQRALRMDLVKRIAEEFDLVKAGPVLINRRSDGSLWLVDGQHRVFGAERAGETEVFAHVVEGLSAKEEADLRLARNDRRPDTIYEKFRARLVAGDEKAHRMQELVMQLGTAINTEPNAKKGINAIAALEFLYDQEPGGIQMTRTLKALQEAFPEEGVEGDRATVGMLKGTWWFLRAHVWGRAGGANYREFIDRLGAAGVRAIDQKARAQKAAMGGSLWLNYYRAMVEVYNFRRQETGKLHWVSAGSAQAGEFGAAGLTEQERRTRYPRSSGGDRRS